MFKNVEKNKVMLEGAYRKVKSYYYYNKNFIIMREKIADFESDEKKMDETFDIMAYHLSHESSKKSVDYFNMLIRQIDFFVLPKKFESGSSSKKSFISNTVPKNKKMKTVNFFIDAPIEIYILDALWTVLLAKIDYDEGILSYDVYGNTINESSLFLNGNTNYESRILFNRYFEKYTSWRNNAFSSLEKNYNLKNDSVLISLDIKSYFYSVVFKFDDLKKYFNNNTHLLRIKHLTKIMRCVYNQYLTVISPYRKDLPEFKTRQYPLPIGLFSSMLLANVYLSDFDKKIRNSEDITYYGRYVDDILIVAKKSLLSNDTNNSIINDVLVSKDFLLEKDGNYYISGKPTLMIQSKKIKILYIDHNESKAIIDIYNDTIKIIPSQADPLPDNNLSLSKFNEVAYSIDNFTKETKIRDIGLIEVDSFKIGRFFSSLVSKYARIDISNAAETLQEQINQINDFFTGSQCIEFYSNWMNYMNFLAITHRNKQLKEFYIKVKNEIKVLKHDSLDKNSYNNIRSINKKAKDTLLKHLDICLYLSLCLDSPMAKKHYKVKMTRINNYIHANIFNHNLVTFPLANYLEYNNEVSFTRMKMSDIGIYPKVEDSFKFKWSPRFIHYDELLLLLFYHYYRENVYGGDFKYLNEDVVKKFTLINHISYKPFSMYHSVNKKFEDYCLRKINIHNETDEIEMPKEIKLAVGSVAMSKEKCIQGYERWKNITLEEKELFASILKDCFKDSDKTGNSPMILVLPELCFPVYWINDLIRFSKRTQIAIVTGLQYISDGERMHNYLATILPFEAGKYRYKNAFVFIREKNDYSPIEFREFAKIGKTCKNRRVADYQIFYWRGINIAPLVCFELTDIMTRALLKGKADLITVPVFNPDTTYFSNIIDSATRDLHALIVQANTSYYGDSRVTGPYDRDSKDIFKIKGGENDHIVLGTVEFKKLIEFQNNYQDNFEKEIAEIMKNHKMLSRPVKKKPNIKPLSARFKKSND